MPHSKDKDTKMYKYNKQLKTNAQELRRNMTKEEKHLWYDFFRLLPIPAKRQKNIENYILDFYIPTAKLAVELDGSQHYTDEHKVMDKERDKLLEGYGIKTLRYQNIDVTKRFDDVCRDIINKINERSDVKL